MNSAVDYSASREAPGRIIIQCPLCEWQPDGAAHWTCGCGHKWNTFETNARCPNCGKQAEETVCPGCGEHQPNEAWYHTPADLEQLEKVGDPVLRGRKKRLEGRLIDYGIKNYRVSDLAYVDYSHERFQTPFDAGCRMMILYGVAYAARNLNQRPDVVKWLKEEGIWGKVSPTEKVFLSGPEPPEETLIDLSLRMEGALTLAWCLQKIATLPRLDSDSTKARSEFRRVVPPPGEALSPFLTQLSYRPLEEIYEENLLNEITVAYFKDLLFNGGENETRIDRHVSLERYKALNWLRTCYDGATEVTGELWDDADVTF